MRSLSFFGLLAVACQSTPAPIEVPKPIAREQMPIEPHTHKAATPPPPQTEYAIPGDQKTVQLSRPITDITCDDYENMAKLACLFPNQKVPFPICNQDDAYAVEGLVPYALCGQHSDVIDLHMAYARDAYAPSTVGLMQRAKAQIEHQSIEATRPLLYQENVTGEDAHMLMTAIWAEWKITGKFTDGAKTVIEEQAKRQPDCLYYQFIHDAAQNSFEGSIQLASKSRSNCDYFMGKDNDSRTIDIIFTQSQIVKSMK